MGDSSGRNSGFFEMLASRFWGLSLICASVSKRIETSYWETLVLSSEDNRVKGNN